MKWKPLFAVLLGLLMVGVTTGSASAKDVFSLTFKNKNGLVVFAGQEDHFYCSWKFLSGQPYDAWGIRMYYVPGKYLTILDHWGRGAVYHPQTYKWFVSGKINAGDSSPYDSYFHLPAPWLKVRYKYFDGTNEATYKCSLDLFTKAIPIFNIPIYIKRKTVTASFKVFILGPVGSYMYKLHLDYLANYNGGAYPEKISQTLSPLPNMMQVKNELKRILYMEKTRPDFIIVDVKKIGNTKILTIEGYKKTSSDGEAYVIFKHSKRFDKKEQSR